MYTLNLDLNGKVILPYFIEYIKKPLKLNQVSFYLP